MSTEHASSQPRNWQWWFSAGRFWFAHVVCLAAIWTGFDVWDVVICLALYTVRMFGVTAGYHRYFSHRTYKMGRVPQFLMAFLAQTSAQKGVLWWASHHRHHHKFSDTPEDVHSVRHGGFWWAHVGWIFDDRWDKTELSRVKDLAKFPELMWLDRFDLLPAFVFAGACFAFGGWTGLIVWGLWSTVLLWHGTFTINSLSHVFGNRRYETTDDSKNNLWLALITLGEGWHNNHHHFQASVNQGFYWWEIDVTYYALLGLSKIGVVSDMKRPPLHVVENRPHPLVAFRKAVATIKAETATAMDELAASGRARALSAQVLFEDGVARARHEAHEMFEDGVSRARQHRDGLVQRLDEVGAAVEGAALAFELRLTEIETLAEQNIAELERSAIEADREAMKMADEIAASGRRTLSEIREKGESVRAALHATAQASLSSASQTSSPAS